MFKTLLISAALTQLTLGMDLQDSESSLNEARSRSGLTELRDSIHEDRIYSRQSPISRKDRRTSIDQKQLAREEYDSKREIEELKQQNMGLSERTQALEKLMAQQRTTPPVFKKVIPADKILLTSVVFAFMNFYSMYEFSGSFILASSSFFSSLYACYAFLKIARDAASVAGNSPFVNKIG